MRVSLPSPLVCIPKSIALIKIHPAWTLVLAALAVCLSIGAVLLGRHLGLPDQPAPDDLAGLFQRVLLNLAVLLPLELYFYPRWILAMDAYAPGESRNSIETWKQLFEERWGRVFLARTLLAAASSIGFVLCIVPGVLVLLFFGWTPWRVLLHGESIRVAAGTAARNMAALWPQALMAASTIFLIVVLSNEIIARACAGLSPKLVWHISNTFGQMTLVWMNAALLGLYQWMESTLANIKKGAS